MTYKKLLIIVLILVALTGILGWYLTHDDMPKQTTGNNAPVSPAPSPNGQVAADSETVPTPTAQTPPIPSSKYGKSLEISKGFMVTVYKLGNGTISDDPEFRVTLKAANGWTAQDDGKYFVYEDSKHDVSSEVAAVTSVPFTESLKAGQSKSYRIQVGTHDRNGTVELWDGEEQLASWHK